MDNTTLFFQIFGLNKQSSILDQLMVFGATHLIYLTILFVLLLSLKGKTADKKAFLTLLLAIPISILLIKVIHLFFVENRPFVAFHFLPIVGENADASFPSRHTTISAVIAFSYTYFKSKWALPFIFIATWIGLSRVYVGVHYPLDIIGGFVTAATAILIALRIKRLLNARFFR